MSDITHYLTKAKTDYENLDHQLEDITRKREIALVRLQTLEMVAGEDLSEIPAPAPARRTTAPPPQRVTSLGKARAAPGSWKAVFASMIARGLSQFSYKDVVQAAKDLAMDAPLPSARVRVSKFKDQGYLERVTEGVYKPTKEGHKFFRG